MTEAVKFRISSVVAAFVRPGVVIDKKLAGIQTAPSLEPSDRVTLLYCLMKDADAAVKAEAAAAFAAFPEEVVLSYIRCPEPHPSLLSELARVYYSNPEITNALLETEQLSTPARQYLLRQQAAAPLPVVAQDTSLPGDDGVDSDGVPEDADVSPQDGLSCEDDERQEDESAEIEEEGEQFLSKFKILTRIAGILLPGPLKKIDYALSFFVCVVGN